MTNRTCSVDGCDRKCHSRGYCAAHYQRIKRFGEPGAAEIKPQRALCSADGCERKHHGQGWCQLHLQRWMTTKGAYLCSIEGCDHRQLCRGLCPAHYKRQRLTGDVGSAEIGLWAFAEGDGGYEIAHRRIQTKRGKALDYVCVECGGQAKEWAYDHTADDERQEELGPYSHDVFHYRPMCVPCHRRFDADLRR